MILPTWGDLFDYHCSLKWHPGDATTSSKHAVRNPFFEEMARRRYNYAPSKDMSSCRLVFLNDVLKNPDNKTLVRKGRFIWCRNLKYVGRNTSGLRQISFTVDRGQKRFVVDEKNMLCIPSNTFINNSRHFRQKAAIFRAFSSVFAYKNTLSMMGKNSELDSHDFIEQINAHNPHKAGTLVAPRKGYFYPTPPPDDTDPDAHHPYGLILGHSFNNNDYSGREFYRVKFGETTYEKVHPVELEIINEV